MSTLHFIPAQRRTDCSCRVRAHARPHGVLLRALLCAVPLFVALVGTPVLGARPTTYSASQGTFTDKVRLTWSPDPIEEVRVRRNPEFPNGAIPRVYTAEFDDLTAVPGQAYSYQLYYADLWPGNDWQTNWFTGWRALSSPAVSAGDGTHADKIRVTWPQAGAATHYRVYRDTASDGSTWGLLRDWQEGTAFDDTAAQPFTTYYYWVKAAMDANGDKESALGAPDSGWRALPAPTGVAAGDGTSRTAVSVSWSAVAGATHYRVFAGRAADGSDRAALSAWQTTRTYSHTGAIPGATYYYWVRAANNAAGNFAGEFGGGDPGWRQLTPSASIRATSGTYTDKIRVTWSSVTGATHYQISRADTPTGTPAALSGWITGTTYDDTSVPPRGTRSYWVRAAVDDSGTHASAFRGPATGMRQLAAPTGVRATDGAHADKVRVTWTAAPAAERYQVYRSDTAAGKKTALGSLQAGTSYDDTTAVPGFTGYYSVQSATAGGSLGLTSSADAGWRALAAPSGVQATQGTLSNAVQVTWGAVAGASHYRVYFATSPTATHIALSLWQTGTTYNHTTASPRVVYCYWGAAAISSGGTHAGPQAGPATGWAGPAGPSGVQASDGTETAHVQVTWTSAGTGRYYRVYRSTSEGGTRTVVGNWQAAALFKDTHALPGATYWYWVTTATSSAGVGETGFGTPDTGWRNLAAPASVQAGDGTATDKFRITWGAVSGATGYEVHRSVAGGAEELLATPNASPYDDTATTPGVLCSYRVRALYQPASGDPFLGPFSAADEGWRALSPPVATASPMTNGVQVSWPAVEGATHYRVQRALSQNGPWSVLGPWLTVRSISDPTAAAGVRYWYAAQAAVNSSGERPSALGPPVSGYRALAAPTGVQASDGTYTDKVRITWSAIAGAAAYQVYRVAGEQRDPVGTWQTGTTCDDVDAVAGTSCTYCVRASNDAAGTLPGIESATDTGYRAMPGPGVWATDGRYADRVRVVWNRPAGATHFRVSRAASRTGAGITLTGWVTATTFDDTTASPGVMCYYFVEAATAEQLAGARGWDLGWRGLESPAFLRASDGEFTDQVLVFWEPVAGATHYRVYREALPDGLRVPLGTWQAGDFFEDTTADPGTFYLYWVRAAADARGVTAGLWGDPDCGWRGLAAPANVTASQGFYPDHVQVYWEAVTGAAVYRVWRQLPGADAAPLSGWQESTMYDDTTAPPNVHCLYWVEAAPTDDGSWAGALSDPAAEGWRGGVAPSR